MEEKCDTYKPKGILGTENYMRREEKQRKQEERRRKIIENKFSLLKDKVLDTTAKQIPLPQESRPEVIELVTERERVTQISKDIKVPHSSTNQQRENL